jgi:predicted PurR-regulated permease PerM
MDALIQTIAKLTPPALLAVLTLGVIGGLGYIIYLLVQQGREARGAMTTLTDNHLHELPAIADTLRRIETQQVATAAALLGQLGDVRESLAYIKAKLNGK